ncbi:MAG TPA: tetratricopeptide repeat protein, partial [Gemmatimonadaceae bacterium]|nr:tetratricopeptide repeat protein [Gemmatimonadaceae bacterium]
KRALPQRSQPARCAAQPSPAPPPPRLADSARALEQAGAAAALLGDVDDARRRFADAARLDPSSQTIAYQYARVLDDAGAATDAQREYCRYLNLAPAAPDADEVRSRLAALPAGGASPMPEAAAVQFRTGVTYADRGELPNAREAFGAAISAAPGLAEAYYDRAAVAVRERRWGEAAADLRRYAQLAPTAPDASAAERQARLLREASRSPGTAFAYGLLPGGGQFYTGRPVFGGVVAAGVVGTVVLALYSTTETHIESAVDPNGIPYTFPVTERVYPYRTGALITGGALLIGAATEAGIRVLFARDRADELRTNTRLGTPRRAASSGEGLGIAPIIAPGVGGGARIGVALEF